MTNAVIREKNDESVVQQLLNSQALDDQPNMVVGDANRIEIGRPVSQQNLISRIVRRKIYARR